MSDFSALVDAISRKPKDKLGRINQGFAHIHVAPTVKEFDTHISVCCSAEYRDTLKKLAKKNKCSVSELVRTYIEWGLENEDSNE